MLFFLLQNSGTGFTFGYTPATGKITLVTDDAIVGTTGAYGVEPGKNARVELGSFMRLALKKDIVENVNFNSQLELFTNYEAENFGNIDVNWQTMILMQVNEYLSANFFTHLLYDDDVKTERIENGVSRAGGAQTQFKNVFGAGLVYKFGTQKAE